MAPKLPYSVDRFGVPMKKEWPYPDPKPDVWDSLLEQTEEDIRVLTPEAARQQQGLGNPSSSSAAKRADSLGSSKPKPANVPPTNIRKRRLILDD